MNFTRNEVTSMRTEMNEALAAVAKKYGAAAKIGNISFGENVKTTITISRLSSNEHGDYINTKEAQEFLRRAKGLGLTQDVLNEKCNYLGNVYVVTGYNSRAPRYPINFTKNGKPMKCGVNFMKEFVHAERPELFL